VVEQRLAGGEAHAFDFADEQSVIARGIFCDNVAGEMSEGALDQRDAGRRPEELNAEGFGSFGILQRFRKEFGDGLLRVFQDIDTKAALSLEEGQQACIVIDANEDEEWIEGYGSKGIRGHAMNLAGLAFNGDDGNAGGKVADDAPKISGFERCGGHRLNSLKITQGRQKTGNRENGGRRNNRGERSGQADG
jgi:hypothetical protein